MVATSGEAGTLTYTMRNTAGLAPPFKPGQSGNPGGRPKGPTLLTRLKRLDKVAFGALLRNLEAPSGIVRQRAFETWFELRAKTAKPEELEAGRRLVEGEYTEAELVALEEQAKLLAKNEEK